MGTQSALEPKNIKDLQQVENKPSKQHLDTVATCLQILSLAKNIKLMEGTLTVWERLIADDIAADKFNMQEFIDAINAGVRMQMYNRIDYADIYQEAKTKASLRKSREANEQRLEGLKEKKGDPMPESVKEILSRG